MIKSRKIDTKGIKLRKKREKNRKRVERETKEE